MSTPSWYAPLPEAVLDALGELLRDPPDDIVSVRLTGSLHASIRDVLRPIAQALEHGRGFVVIENPMRDLDDRRRALLYWLVGQGLGEPVVQNVQGALLYDVR